MRNTGPNARRRAVVFTRSGGRCLRCGGIAVQCHHRKPRGAGGSSDPAINSPENLVPLCLRCHTEIESHRSVAYQAGWLVRRGDDPVEVPLHPLDGSVVMLHRDGTMTVSAPLTSWTPGGELWLTEPPF